MQSQFLVDLAYPACLQALHPNNQKEIILSNITGLDQYCYFCKNEDDDDDDDDESKNKQTDRQADKQTIKIVNVDFIWFSEFS